jgi:anaerobic magnesium-protoporphyrin IX monomethyl ester cyclase
MKIVLCTPPSTSTERWPPIGLLYMAACLKAENYDVNVIDAFSCNLTEAELVSAVKKENPDVVGMNSTAHTFIDAMSATEKIKQATNAKIVLGGYQATFNAEKVLRNYKFVNYVVKGEGEKSFLELINCLSKKKDMKKVKGLAYIDKKFISNEPEIIKDLDALPFPDRQLVMKNDYSHHWNNIRLTFGKFTTILTSRGCPYRCRYCSCAAFTQMYRERGIQTVLDEFEEIYSQGYKTCIFVDDNFTMNEKRVMKICEGIRKRGIDMELHCEGRVNSASLSMLRTMKKAGFSTIYFGIESGSQRVLDYYRKGTTVEQIRNAVDNAKKARMNTIGSFILGAPVENKKEIMHTLRFASSLRLHGTQFNILDLSPGTELWSEFERSGRIRKNDWKSNHRIYEYSDNLTKEYLNQAVNLGYKMFLDGWKDRRAIKELLSNIMSNSSTRKIIAWNLWKNPRNVIRTVR